MISIPEHVNIKSRFRILAETIYQHHHYKQNMHSRIFSFIILDEWITVGESLKGKEYKEHVVPLALIRDQVFKMFEEGESVENVGGFLEKNLKIVLITKKESHKLDYQLGFKSSMPSSWKWGDDEFQRLKQADIRYILYEEHPQ